MIDFSLIKDEVQPPPILNVKTLHQIFVILLSTLENAVSAGSFFGIGMGYMGLYLISVVAL